MIGERRGFPTAFLAPALALAALVWAFPLLYAVALAFTDAAPGAPGRLLGLGNFTRALTDPLFGHALLVSLIFSTGAVLLDVGLGLGLAVAFYRGARSRAALQTIVLLPWAVSEIAVALVWHEFLGEEGGMINWALARLGWGALAWKTSAVGAMSALWLASLWHGLAFSVLLQMAGLASLRPNLLQAARLDGASNFAILRHVVLPHQRGTLIANGLMVWLSAMVTFSLPFALTGGGPLRATELVSLYTYRAAFSGRFELGYAAALGLLVLAFYGVFASLYLRRRRAV